MASGLVTKIKPWPLARLIPYARNARISQEQKPAQRSCGEGFAKRGGYRRDRGVGPLMSLEGGQGPVQDQLGSMEGLGKPREAGLGRTLMCSAKLSWMHHCA